VGGQLNISKNPKLISMPSFNKLTTIGDDLNLTSNPVLQEAIGFNELTYIGNDLNIEFIKIIRGFSKLKIVERFLDIRGITVEEVPEFALLENVGASLRISNTSVKSIVGFNFLERIGEKYFLDDWFSISNNLLLNNVKGFGRFTKVEGDVRVQRNPRLSDCSWLCNLINNGEITGALTIQENIGDCINAIKVILICDIDFDDDTIANAIDLDDDNDGILDTLEGNGTLDTDNDGYPDSLDLDSDNDNCFDVIEAGFEDPNNDGVLGDLPDTVNFQGLIINESSGYTTPDDTNTNGIFDFQELNILSPGKNGLLEICINFANIDLFKSLNGNPDLGGTWSPALASGTSIYNPRKDLPGIYTYTQTDPVCGDLSADVKVEFLSDLSAGIDTAVLTCEGEDRVDLFKALNGNPSPNGFWSPELASGTNVYDRRNDFEAEYTYTIVDRQCGTLQSTVTITNLEKPNSGESTAIQICEFSEPINLFDLLKGDPDTNGVWSPTLTNGIFDPETNNSNTYSYTVDNGACGIAISTVAVEVVKNEALTNVVIIINDFSSLNNNIEVRVYSKREYEYSMDGINYQTENIFNNVDGGKQKVFVRGKDGCEFFSKDVFVRTYPVFFTPNNDGENDFWRLKDFPDVNYTIFIYSRFGQMIKEIKSTTGFWDGNFNGKPIKSSDYWFKVVVTDTGEILHGNFSLIRK
jgi:gliding motility-associated-like protein